MPRGIYKRNKSATPSPLPLPAKDEPLSLDAIVENLEAREAFLTEQLAGMEKIEIELQKTKQAINALKRGATDIHRVSDAA